MSTVSFRSLSAPTMRSAVLIWPTRISTLAKSSIPIFSLTAGAGAAAAAVPAAARVAAGAGAGAAVGLSSSLALDSILSIASVLSTRGKRGCGLPGETPVDGWAQRRPSRFTAGTEAVSEIAVVAGDEGIVAEIAVLAEDHFAQHEIAEGVHPEHVGNGAWKDYVALGLGHFAGVHQEPAVRPNLFGNRKHRGHQECG